MLPYINKPTRVTGTTATLIDNIFTNLPNNPHDVQVIIPSDISDHFPVCFFAIDLSNLNDKDKVTRKRDFSKVNMNRFSEKLQATSWEKIINENDTQSAYTDFHSTITENFESCFSI